MKEAIILEKSEYKYLTDRIEYLESRVDSLEYENENLRWDISVSSYAYDEIRELKNTIWELRNRADIDAFNEASDVEFYNWANAIADKYNNIYEQEIAKEITNEEKDWLKEVKRKYCKNCTEYIDKNGEFQIITFDEMETYKFCLQNLPKGTDTHGWDEDRLASDSYYFDLSEEYDQAKDTKKNKYHYYLMMYYWCETCALTHAEYDHEKFREWQESGQWWLRQYYNALKYGLNYIWYD